MCIYVHWELNLHFFMTDNMKTILIFKTSVKSERSVDVLAPYLDRLINKNGKWNFDLEDCDNILRVETQSPNSQAVLTMLQKLGFSAEELF